MSNKDLIITPMIAYNNQYYLPRKEVIQPQVLLRLPCYDFSPITTHTLDIGPLFRLA